MCVVPIPEKCLGRRCQSNFDFSSRRKARPDRQISNRLSPILRNRSNGISTIVRATSLAGTITPEYEIHLITRTHGRQFVGDYIGEFCPGNLLLTGSNLPHNWMSDLKPGEVIEGRDVVIQFAPDLLRSGADVFPELANLEPFLTDTLRGFEFFGDAALRGTDLMRSIGVARGFQRLALFFELIDLFARAPEKKILASPNTVARSTKLRFVVIMTLVRS